jgi:hypothetical protein
MGSCTACGLYAFLFTFSGHGRTGLVCGLGGICIDAHNEGASLSHISCIVQRNRRACPDGRTICDGHFTESAGRCRGMVCGGYRPKGRERKPPFAGSGDSVSVCGDASVQICGKPGICLYGQYFDGRVGTVPVCIFFLWSVPVFVDEEVRISLPDTVMVFFASQPAEADDGHFAYHGDCLCMVWTD